ncbi:ion transporter [Crocinitomix catalasitica]|uniref:ion transporter n=1 Tax=Crocinitomix catalasitica TaxID=184607 RepID=UPI000480B91E|nr:ion transporter [Crocinitomix catalasitica]
MSPSADKEKLAPWRLKIHEVIFEADTKAGKTFDIILLIAILLSILIVMLESVKNFNDRYHQLFLVIEWGLTILFTIEYIIRIISIKKPWSYILSFYGVVDLLSILPTFLGLFLTGTHTLTVIRSLRLLRVFRILKLGKYLKEVQSLNIALRNSKRKIIVFLGTVLTLVIILGTLMYLIETEESGFTSIPRSIYWAIVTLTTVGYGDIYPSSELGQFIASIVMITGYAIIAVPTGIVTTEMARVDESKLSTQSCTSCAKEGHDKDAEFCKYCGENLHT